MKRLVESGAPLSFDPAAWRGEMIVSTRHTVYRLKDGVCTGVHNQDVAHKRGDFVGMKILGWLVDEDTLPAVSRRWRLGASAILIRPGALGQSLALTSPTVDFCHDASPDSSGFQMHAPPSYHAVVDSMTRIGVPNRRA
jgi:hypothetical protein